MTLPHILLQGGGRHLPDDIEASEDNPARAFPIVRHQSKCLKETMKFIPMMNVYKLLTTTVGTNLLCVSQACLILHTQYYQHNNTKSDTLTAHCVSKFQSAAVMDFDSPKIIFERSPQHLQVILETFPMHRWNPVLSCSLQSLQRPQVLMSSSLNWVVLR